MSSQWITSARIGLCAAAVLSASWVHAQSAAPASDAHHAAEQMRSQQPAKKMGHQHHHGHKASHGKYATPQQHEAAAVRGERRQGKGPANPRAASMNDFERNALRRCDVFKNDEDRRACVERVRHPKISGSVEGGGWIREYTQTVPVQTAPAPSQHPHLMHPPVQPIRPAQ